MLQTLICGQSFFTLTHPSHLMLLLWFNSHTWNHDSHPLSYLWLLFSFISHTFVHDHHSFLTLGRDSSLSLTLAVYLSLISHTCGRTVITPTWYLKTHLSLSHLRLFLSLISLTLVVITLMSHTHLIAIHFSPSPNYPQCHHVQQS